MEHEENPAKLAGSCWTSYNIPNSFLWSPLTHQRTYRIKGVFEDLLANMTYLAVELEKLKSSFPLDANREDAHEEEKLLERTIEKYRQMTRQVRKSKKETIGRLEDGTYVNPREYNPSKYPTAASLPFAIQE